MAILWLPIFLLGFYHVGAGIIIVDSGAGTVHPTCDLTIEKDGNVVEDGATVVGYSGDLNQLYCKALCVGPGPTPALTWYGTHSKRIPMARQRVYQVLTTSNRVNILTIRTMLGIDRGKYTCKGWIKDRGWVKKTVDLQYGCPKTYHMCDTSRCISSSLICDGKPDCNDFSDEEFCSYCKDEEFHCGQLQCIPKERKCDGHDDCAGGQDEQDCPFEVMIVQSDVEVVEGDDAEFVCKALPSQRDYEFTWTKIGGRLSDKAVPNDDRLMFSKATFMDAGMYVCKVTDGVTSETATGTLVVNERCPGQFECLNGTCIPNSFVCNVVADCALQEDEFDCEYCKGGEFHCGDSLCIPNEKKCDGQDDCANGLDESGCPFEVIMVKSDVEVVVGDYAEFVCIALPNQRDYEFTWTKIGGELSHKAVPNDDRLMFSDVTFGDAGTYVCKVTDGVTSKTATGTLFITERCLGQFECQNGTCIPISYHCNAVADCARQEDEIGCEYCKVEEFHCGDLLCIPNEKKCDGHDDCADGLDESDCKFEVTMVESHLEVFERYDAAFVCEVRPNQRDYKFTWTKRGGNFSDNAASFAGRLVLSNVTFQDAGTYVCEVTDGVMSHTAEGDLVVLDRCPGQFECLSGKCIPISYKCDNIPDCDFREDETDCGCFSDEFECGDGSCIPDAQLCDAVAQCEDGSDELECCSETEFQCQNRMCINGTSRCDRVQDCANGEDEVQCECLSSEFQCSDGKCIDNTKVCDAFPDCENDEINCGQGTCLEGLNKCKDGNGCFTDDQRCDGKSNCADNSDETLPECQTDNIKTVPESGESCPSVLKCPDGSCLESTQVCDGVSDCSDGWDEAEYCIGL